MGANCTGIVALFKHLLRVRAHAPPIFSGLSYECPWVLAQDNTVLVFMLKHSIARQDPRFSQDREYSA